MNNRNELDSRNELHLWEYLRPLFFLAVVAVIVGGIATVQCGEPKEQPKPNIRVPYNPLYKNTECKDWQSDSTMTQGKIEVLNEILAR